jgi:hypothetical protein
MRSRVSDDLLVDLVRDGPHIPRRQKVLLAALAMQLKGKTMRFLIHDRRDILGGLLHDYYRHAA